MKRIASAITGLLALALLTTGMAPASASTPSTVCRNGYLTEVQVLDSPSPIYVGLETSADPTAGSSSTSVCYKDGALTGIGGYVNVTYEPGNSYVQLYCAGDLPATVALSCFSYADLNSTDPDPSSPGSAVSGWVKVEGLTGTLPLTGVEVGSLSTNTAGSTAADSNGACAWVLGTQLLPSCSATLAGAWVNREPVPVVATGTVPVCAGVFVGGTCLGTWVDVPVVRDAYSRSGDRYDTVGVTALGQDYTTGATNEGCTGYRTTDTDPACDTP